MSEKEYIKRALYDAIDWQISFSESYTKGAPEREEAIKLAGEYRKILKRKYGVGKTPNEALEDRHTLKSMSLDELRALPTHKHNG